MTTWGHHHDWCGLCDHFLNVITVISIILTITTWMWVLSLVSSWRSLSKCESSHRYEEKLRNCARARLKSFNKNEECTTFWSWSQINMNHPSICWERFVQLSCKVCHSTCIIDRSSRRCIECSKALNKTMNNFRGMRSASHCTPLIAKAGGTMKAKIHCATPPTIFAISPNELSCEKELDQ